MPLTDEKIRRGKRRGCGRMRGGKESKKRGEEK